ncbi:hypothetical protein GGI43DRAFT_385399 [Trichoderma evansii]
MADDEELSCPVTSTITSTTSDCENIYGCSLTDRESATTVTSGACALPTGDSKGDVNYIMFYWIPMLDKDTLDTLLKSEIARFKDACYYEEWNAKVGVEDLYEDPLEKYLSAADYTRHNVPTQDDGP